MNEFTHQNFCQHAEELVSYLYEETSLPEKSRFEEHLVNCSSCADDLADFAFVCSSIVEWRDQEFLPLAVPVIELPAQKVVFVPEISKSNSLLARLRALFSLSPVWAGAGAAAALVICIGLIFVAVNFRRAPETASLGDAMKIETDSSPTTTENADAQTVIAENEQITVSEKSPEPPIVSIKENNEKPENAAVKAPQSVTDVKTKKPVADKFVKPAKPVTRKSNQSPPPTLMADEDVYEDNSLRLADIFKGVGGR